ncbi:hypothetical protein A2483_00375 [Candidatus Peregrinibacteria bacterium RIFOXYC2_FULL_33_13]|nr:MAG: hypothetical protein UR27_C0019G0005 [Candidatus Peregrinibacteria bacterium GW2011_GWA2_33_10]KKP39923.1 MAG: hypothetical protein UR30_C0007G0024 [Candidatus Peregrinibacteria bacterium GW2011_GWC2_33_13]OGJ47163.1 MAG: hypothetical protein A2229_00355 [Candidatus Peregrinibacteria bacterium RIFOXYA2_FULL_33_7]OGJ53235.1 MAG: hypothetical protein A2483_00375 [Candidatus Peregrinibacteria bacterium RIFOXYC2_FULL_33_13]
MLEKLKNHLASNSPTYLRVKVIPKSTKTEIVEILDDETIKIRLNAAPEKGKANIELIAYLSKTFKIPKNNITIISGHATPLKLIKII